MSPYETFFYNPSFLVFLHLPQYPRLFVLQTIDWQSWINCIALPKYGRYDFSIPLLIKTSTLLSNLIDLIDIQRSIPTHWQIKILIFYPLIARRSRTRQWYIHNVKWKPVVWSKWLFLLKRNGLPIFDQFFTRRRHYGLNLPKPDHRMEGANFLVRESTFDREKSSLWIVETSLASSSVTNPQAGPRDRSKF